MSSHPTRRCAPRRATLASLAALSVAVVAAGPLAGGVGASGTTTTTTTVPGSTTTTEQYPEPSLYPVHRVTSVTVTPDHGLHDGDVVRVQATVEVPSFAYYIELCSGPIEVPDSSCVFIADDVKLDREVIDEQVKLPAIVAPAYGPAVDCRRQAQCTVVVGAYGKNGTASSAPVAFAAVKPKVRPVPKQPHFTG
jgi:hypothetical protein